MSNSPKYTFSVTCPLPPTPQGEARSMTTFVYDAPDKDVAKSIWWACYLARARKNGLRGSKAKLQKSLKLIVERANKRELTKGNY